MVAWNYDRAMSDEYVDLDAAAEAMYEEAGKPDGEKQVVIEDQQQEKVEDKKEGESTEETEEASEEVTAEEKSEEKESEDDDEEEAEDPKRVRIGKWSPVDRRAATIAAKAGIPLEKALEIAKEQLGVTDDEADADATPEIPDTVAKIRSTLEEKRTQLTEITTKLDSSDEDYDLTAKDIRKLSKQETDLKLEIQRLEIQEEQEQAEYEYRVATAEDFDAKWNEAVRRGIEEFPESEIEDSRLSDAMHVAIDKFSRDKNHKYKGNPEAPYLILKEVAARLDIKSAKESQSEEKGTEQAKATQKPVQKAGYRPVQGSAATAAKSASQEGITQEAVAKALQEGGPEAVAALYDAEIYSGSKAAQHGLGFAIA